MKDESDERGLATRLIHPAEHASTEFHSLAMPTFRGSTVVLGSMDQARRSDPEQYRYGILGTPTARELALRIQALEGAQSTFLAPSGQAAIALTYLAFCKTGTHMLLPESAYGPSRAFADEFLEGLGIEVESYDPLLGSGIAALIRDKTALIWCESPGSITMEVQDVPAICAVARAHGVPVAIDNTYGAGILFDAFAAGVDVSVQALTKYAGGHSDLLMGSISVRSEADGARIRRLIELTGSSVSADDCSLVLRGLKTLSLRLERVQASTLKVAEWLGGRKEVKRVLHPAFPHCPGHDVWKRDFRGSASVFSIVVRDWSPAQVVRFAESLELFKIGYSWGGANSLVMCYPQLRRPSREDGSRLVRLNIGLEDPEDLIQDLAAAFEKANAVA